MPHMAIAYSHPSGEASLGILQSPRGDSATEPTFGESGAQFLLNCWVKNLFMKRRSHFPMAASSYFPENAWLAVKSIFSGVSHRRMKW